MYSDNNTLRNLVITGIGLDNATSHHNYIVHNYIGTDVTGMVARNENTNGIEIEYGAHDNIIGGTTAAERNIIAGHTNTGGILIHANAQNNQVTGNWIGINVAGNALPNRAGIFLQDGATGNIIGGQRASAACSGPCNVISGNSETGVAAFDAGTSNNQVIGNYLGLNAGGSAARPNGYFGVSLNDGVSQNQVGGSRSGTSCIGPCNVISGNGGDGVLISGADADNNTVAGNFIGTNPAGTTAFANTYHGVEINDQASENTIGGSHGTSGYPCDSHCNLISGNGQVGVLIAEAGSDQNKVVGNYIGVNGAGTQALMNNYYGVALIASFTDQGPARSVIDGDDAPVAIQSGLDRSGVLVKPGKAVAQGALEAGASGSPGAVAEEGQTAREPSAASGAAAQAPQANGPDQTQIGGSVPAESNLISGNYYGGIMIDGSGTQQTRVTGNRIGYDRNKVPLLNDNGGVIASTGSISTTIGGALAGEANEINGAIFVYDAPTRAAVEGNEVTIPDAWSAAGYLPIDLDVDGATCSPWQGGTGTNGAIPAPRLMRITSGGLVEGATRPGARVDIYRMEQAGSQVGRYFARSVKAVGHGTADANGKFSIATTLAANDQVAATVTVGGGTSELSQLRRPVIFVHGIGGSWLRSATNDWLWLPPVGTSNTVNNRLARLALDAAGNSLEPVTVNGVIEIGGWAVYGPVLDWLEDHGYSRTGNAATNDIWPFAYDWRLALTPRANDLRQLADDLTNPLSNAARACDVDIVAHSMGGMVSSLVVRNNPTFSQDHIHRLITLGTPYLGTPQAASAHSTGYVFGLERIYSWVTFDWGRMLQMARNLTAGYTLMPSPNYFPASGALTYLSNLQSVPAVGYGQTFGFMTAPKLDGAGNPQGLDRNAALWAAEQTAVHNQIDDWTGWSGPPQVFRIVGDTGLRTAIGWRVGPMHRTSNGALDLRREPGDSNQHVVWRSSQYAILGRGDETVALPSARLGRGTGTDFSGVDAWWVQNFDTFNRDHLALVTEDDSLTRMTNILHGGFTVPTLFPETEPTAPASVAEDLFYLFGSEPVAVHVTDSQGRHTGPITPTHYSEIEFNVPGASYWPNDYAVSLSLLRGETYTLTVEAPVSPMTLRVMRLVPDSSGTNEQVFFPDRDVAIGGSLQMVLPAASLPSNAPFAVDADGNGIYEDLLAPSAVLTSSATVPVVPEPHPWDIRVSTAVTATTNPTITVTIPSGGDTTWQWQAAADVAWITPQTLNGTAPATVTATLASLTQPIGVHTGTLTITLSSGGYQVDYPITVQLTVDGWCANGSPYDVNCDGQVNVLDVQAVAGAWNTAVGHPAYSQNYDLDRNGGVDIRDVQLEVVGWSRY